MTKSDEYRAKAEECRVMAAKVTTPIDKAAWLELATHWLGLIREPARTASERFHAMERNRGTRQQKSSAEHKPPACPRRGLTAGERLGPENWRQREGPYRQGRHA